MVHSCQNDTDEAAGEYCDKLLKVDNPFDLYQENVLPPCLANQFDHAAL